MPALTTRLAAKLWQSQLAESCSAARTIVCVRLLRSCPVVSGLVAGVSRLRAAEALPLPAAERAYRARTAAGGHSPLVSDSTAASGAVDSGPAGLVNPRRHTKRMANSKYEYVKKYELDDTLLPGCWIVVRIDGKGFTKFSELHGFDKPNDKAALDLMDAAAKEVLREFPDVRIAFGESDEYSFVLAKSTEMYGRRSSKVVSLLVSCFTANYVRLWPALMAEGMPLRATPMFDGRAVCYPDDATLRDYLSWRQADAHINNQYNTCFWALVKSGKTPPEAQATLKGTQTEFKNELLFTQFGINYAHLPEQFKKGSVVIRQRAAVVVKHRDDGTPVVRERNEPAVLHCDIIRDDFWKEHPHLLAP